MTKIFYFSSTGNSLWSAKKIAELTGSPCELFNIGEEMQKTGKTMILEADAVVLIFPSYAYGLPLIVSRFIKKAEFKTPYIAVFTTYGTFPGGTLAAASRILKQKNIKTVYYGRIPAVENYIALFGAQKERTIQKRLAMQRDATEKAASCILKRQVNRVNTFRPFSAFVSLLFSFGVTFFYKYYRLSDACNGCGICEKLCPVSAIAVQDKRPVFSGKCEHCQGCLSWCPQKAISFGRLKYDTARYRHPEITIADLSRNNKDGNIYVRNE